jgi:hypothetical protein
MRFARFGGSLVRTDDLRKSARGLALAGGVLAGAALVLGLILWLGRAQPSNQEQQGRTTGPETVISRV